MDIDVIGSRIGKLGLHLSNYVLGILITIVGAWMTFFYVRLEYSSYRSVVGIWLVIAFCGV